MIDTIIHWLLYTIIKLPETRITETIEFFIYDSIKIFLLLFVFITIVGIIRTYIPLEKLRPQLQKKGVGAHLIASLLGAITPFCSCSSIPLFISFIKAKIPVKIALSFLITSPIVNEYVAIIMFSLFGWKITLAYIITGILIGVIAGYFIGKNKSLEQYIIQDVQAKEKDASFHTIKERIRFGIQESVGIIKKLWAWLFVGIGLGAIIHNFIPETLITSITTKTGLFAVPLAVIIGVPLYGNAAGIIPIAVALFEKGLLLGTTMALMMAITALSLPEAIILRRIMKLKLIGIFFLTITISIIIMGYLFNILQPFLSI